MSHRRGPCSVGEGKTKGNRKKEKKNFWKEKVESPRGICFAEEGVEFQ